MRRLLAFLFSIAPFVAGAIAALGARHDVRMLWMALAARWRSFWLPSRPSGQCSANRDARVLQAARRDRLRA